MQITNRKFAVEQFDPGQQAWIGNLLSPLNLLIQQLVSGFSNSVTVQENLYQELKTVAFTNEAASFPLTFRTKFMSSPLSLAVGYCATSAGEMPTAYPWPVWSYANGSVTVSSIAGLTSGASYVARFHLIYG